jgi:hypothetical protein
MYFGELWKQEVRWRVLRYTNGVMMAFRPEGLKI